MKYETIQPAQIHQQNYITGAKKESMVNLMTEALSA
jgi:hypothetical protein